MTSPQQPLRTKLELGLRMAENREPGEDTNVEQLDQFADEALQLYRQTPTLANMELCVRLRLACAVAHIELGDAAHFTIAAQLCDQRGVWGLDGPPLGLVRVGAACDYNYALALALHNVQDYARQVQLTAGRACVAFTYFGDMTTAAKAALIAALGGVTYGHPAADVHLKPLVSYLQDQPRLLALANKLLGQGTGTYPVVAHSTRRISKALFGRFSPQVAALSPNDVYRFVPPINT